MKDNIKQFWDWFKDNNKLFLFVNQKDEKEKELLLDQFLENLHKYCDQLWFEIGGNPDEPLDLIITAEGNIDYYDMVEKLVNAAPKIENWNIIAFKPPMGTEFEIKFEDVELIPNEMWFMPLENQLKPTSLGLRIGIKNYKKFKKSKWLQATVNKVLDTVLGEKSFAFDIEYLEIVELPKKPQENGMLELQQLHNYVSWHKNKYTN